MSDRVITHQSEYVKPVDLNRLGEFPQAALDDVVNDAVSYPAHWSGFTVSEKSEQVVTVSPGRYFEQSKVFRADAAVDINLTILFPNSSTQERWIALIASGETVQVNEERGFKAQIDPETGLPVAIQTPVIEKRVITITPVGGIAAPAPADKPAIANPDCCIAFVRVTTQGIQEIELAQDWRVRSLFEVEGRLTDVELRVDQLYEDTETIRTDLGNVAANVEELRKQIPNARLFEQIVRDTARHSQALNLPDEARNYFFDQALLKDFWDFTAGGNFRIDEGIRFPPANQASHILRLLDYDAPTISVWDNRLVMPAYTEVARITSPEGTGKKDIAGVVHTVTTAVKKTKSHTRIRYGETVSVCENTAGWTQLGSLKAGSQFQSGGETWQSLGINDDPWNQNPASAGHKSYSVQRIIRDTVTSTYVTYNTETFGLSGAIHGQSFLCSQVMVATSVDLNFTKVDGTTGDVILCLCEVNSVGAPDFQAVLAKTTVARSALVVGWNKFSFEPTLLDQGKRYAWFVTTTGNHQLKTNSGNAYGGGSMFISSDGVWAQGSTTEDFTFRLNAARFTRNRVVMEFEPLTLENGMTEIDMIFKAWEPAATSLVWEIKAQGDTEWVPMDAREDNPLANLPPLVQLRAVMIGTQDVAPAIDLDTYARAIPARMALSMTAISKLKTFGFATTEAQVVLNMDSYEAAKHTAVPKLMLADNTVVTASAVVTEVDPAKPSRTKFTADFTLPGGTTQARVRVEATTSDVTAVPFGQDIQLNAF
ncbi:hypothetical protein [Shinella zoogloeoides]|uniref:hypothetical protein n=1 Tax=Shinella zoogloeoides TaxID=352475 RepID=UPI001F55BDC9|nr:hypothetical protein [Shinella zoogloeoides]